MSSAVVSSAIGAVDTDGDGIDDSVDNCLTSANPSQRDTDMDGLGNACDADLDNDCIINFTDLGLIRSVFFSADPDADFNGDGVVNFQDLGILRLSFFTVPGPSAVAEHLCAPLAADWYPGELYPTQRWSEDPRIGDVNGDGIADLVVENSWVGYERTSVLFGNGDGTFEPFTSVDGSSVVLGNMDEDEELELVVKDIQAVFIYSWDSEAMTFERRTVPTSLISAAAHATADVNGDGMSDILLVNATTNAVHVLPAIADGTFGAEQIFSTGGNVSRAIAIDDLNNDGFLDIVTANGNTNDVSVLAGNGDGSFQPPLQFLAGDGPNVVTIGDLNGDGVPDVVTGNQVFTPQGRITSVSVLFGAGDGSFSPEVRFGEGLDRNLRAVSIADINADGLPDIYTSVGRVYENQEGGSFVPTPDAPVDYLAGTAADVNGDGIVDIARAWFDTDMVHVALGVGDGTYIEAQHYTPGDAPADLIARDFNGSGRADVAAANELSDDVSVLISGADGKLQPAASYAVGDAPVSLAAGDLNGDGSPDLVTANRNSNDVSVLLGNADGTFDPQLRLSTGDAPIFTVVGNINGDSNPDLLVVNRASRSLTIFAGDGAGTFAPAEQVDLGISLLAANAGDFNGDGFLDVAVGVESGFWVVLNAANGEFDEPFYVDANAFSDELEVYVHVFDINDDGVSDVFFATDVGFGGNLFIGAGDGSFLPRVYYSLGGLSRARDATAADLNDDGLPDLMFANFWTVPDNDVEDRSAADMVILAGDGDGRLRNAVRFFAGLRPTSIAAGDVTGDGRLDIVVASRSADTITVIPQLTPKAQ